ncbi:MAG: DUF599 domain-containing protein [Asgard group archaeon]|nr:DUF599 domain-containing protein [Asgard group archaeon]
MLDEIAFFILILCYIISIIMLYYSLNKEKTRKGVRRRILKNWVFNNIDLKNMNAVQAIRNLIIVNNAFISALLVLTGLLIGLFSNIFTDNTIFLWGIIPSVSIKIAQIILVGFFVMFCLFNFINSNRMAANLSFLITTDPETDVVDKEQKEQNILLIRDTFRISQRSWMLGIRGIFYLVATITWLIHPVVLIVSSVIITLYVILAHDFSIFEKRLPG